MTTLEMPTPTESRRPTPAGTRFVDVRANLMPPEVLAARQTDVVRRRVLGCLGAVAALIAIGFGASWYQTHSARGDLADLNRSIAARQSEQGSFGKLAQAQNDAQTVRTTLSQVMAGDLSYFQLITRLQKAAPSGMTLTTITSATPTSSAPTATTVDPLNASGKTIVATLTLAGTASDAKSVAAFSDAVGKLDGLTSVLVTGVSNGGKGGVTFTMSASLTNAVLGGRFTPTQSSTTTTGATGATTGSGN